ncbi:MAG: asparagine synthase (glutamine-hydrolyzing) [Candidatus Manganitrophaceae bacterium]
MCGILGAVARKGVEEGQLALMRDVMAHRGPDDSALWLSPDRTVGLAHRRLSILDLSQAGRQPMSDRDGKIWIIFNGEIYNFREIREELVRDGFTFRSHTDTEVLINAYKKWGTDCLQQLNGMFAFGIYDENSRTLFLARDRAGKKPLYYAEGGGRFAFASELKALIKDEKLSRELDLYALNFYFTFGYIPGELCIFKAVRKLAPAHAMTYEIGSGRKRIWRYWEPPVGAEVTPPEDELLEELETLLEDAVRLRMISDVPLGAFLSGGIDSSLVVAMMSRLSDRQVKTFSIGFDESQYNELPYAKLVARHFNTDHREIMVKPDAFSILPILVHQFDEPFADSSLIPTYYVSKATREYVTVALSGDGGDELFGGYQRYLATKANAWMANWTPFFLRKFVSSLASLLPDGLRGKNQLLRLKLNGEGAFLDRLTHGFFNLRARQQLFSKEVLAEIEETISAPEEFQMGLLKEFHRDFLSRLMYTDFRIYLPDDVLVKVDRASMLTSLEVRAPFLDYRIAEFSFGKVPSWLKIHGWTKKHLLKKLARKLLPRELDLNRKQGFGLPIAEWFRGPLKGFLSDAILAEGNPFLETSSIARLLQRHLGCQVDESSRLFTILMFELWRREYLT